jgi:hypothetical protein
MASMSATTSATATTVAAKEEPATPSAPVKKEEASSPTKKIDVKVWWMAVDRFATRFPFTFLLTSLALLLVVFVVLVQARSPTLSSEDLEAYGRNARIRQRWIKDEADDMTGIINELLAIAQRDREIFLALRVQIDQDRVAFDKQGDLFPALRMLPASLDRLKAMLPDVK